MSTPTYYGKFRYEGAPMLVTLIKTKVLSYPSIHERINDREWTEAVYPWVNHKFYKPSYFEILPRK
jgi:hypothetical protein